MPPITPKYPDGSKHPCPACGRVVMVRGGRLVAHKSTAWTGPRCGGTGRPVTKAKKAG